MIKTLPSRQRILSEVATMISMAESFRGRSADVINLIAPYCNSDIIVTYRPESDDYFHVVSSWGEMDKAQTRPYSIFNITDRINASIDKNKILSHRMAREIGLSLPCLEDKTIISAMIFPFKVDESIHGFMVFASRTHHNWSEDNVEWLCTVASMIKGSIHRTIANEKLAAQLSWRDKIYPIIAHDLRSTVGTVRMLLDAVRDAADAQEESDLLEMARNNSTEAFMLLDNLLKWSRMQVGKTLKPHMAPVNFLEQINMAYQYYQPIARIKGIELSTDLPSEDFTTLIDTEMIMTVVRNLLSNAIKFTKKGGQITMGVRLNEASINLWVEDNGIGMKESELEKLKNATEYFSHHGTGGEKGSGLGLSLVREFLSLHGGRLTVSSTPCVGSRFSFNIPQLC